MLPVISKFRQGSAVFRLNEVLTTSVLPLPPPPGPSSSDPHATRPRADSAITAAAPANRREAFERPISPTPTVSPPPDPRRRHIRHARYSERLLCFKMP